MTDEAINRVEISLGTPKTTFSTPAGRPASANARANATAGEGVSSAGLMMQGQPAARDAAIFREDRIAGKFHGENAATAPTGSLTTSQRWPFAREGTIRP